MKNDSKADFAFIGLGIVFLGFILIAFYMVWNTPPDHRLTSCSEGYNLIINGPDDDIQERWCVDDNGKPDGMYYKYHPDNTILEKGKYEKGRKDGEFNTWFYEGTGDPPLLQWIKVYKNGKLIRKKIFDGDGSLTSDETYTP